MQSLVASIICAGICAFFAFMLTRFAKQIEDSPFAPPWFASGNALYDLSKKDWSEFRESVSPAIRKFALLVYEAAILFVAQGMFYQIIPFFIPVIVLIVTVLLGILGVYRAAQK